LIEDNSPGGRKDSGYAIMTDAIGISLTDWMGNLTGNGHHY
jgi:hypothetical protein